MSFDLSTIHTILFLTQLVFASYHLVSWLRSREQTAYLIWAAGNLLCGVGSFMLLYQAALPTFFATVAPAALMAALLAFAWIGLRVALGQAAPWRLAFAVLAVQIGVASYFALVEVILWPRLAALSVTSVLFCVFIIVDIYRLRKTVLAGVQSAQVIMTAFGAHAIMMSLMFLGTVINRPTHSYIGADSPLTSLFVLEALLCAIVINLSIFLLIHERLRERLKVVANTDALTRLPNRTRLEDLYASVIRAADWTEARPAVAILDLDGFKEVNDTLGHERGDRLLQLVAGTLQEAVGARGDIARLGGDEFAVVLRAQPSLETQRDVCVALQDVLRRSFDLGGPVVRSGCSVGLTEVASPQVTLTESLRRADIAMYEAKGAGRDTTRVFRQEMDDRRREFTWLRRELDRALEQGALSVAYQPKFDVRHGRPRLSGAEALVRWIHPERGFISPGDFIPVAEREGLIHRLGCYVLRQASRDAARWSGLQVAVNLSPMQFEEPALVDDVFQILSEEGLSPQGLELEVTEGVLMRDDAQIRDTLQAFRERGVRLALDDFGTGFSSLSYLQSFDFDVVKIDRSFVQNCSRTDEAKAITRAVVQLSRAIDADVVAEGVETEEELALLRSFDCTHVQGYLLGKPMPIEAFEDLRMRDAEEEAAEARLASETGAAACA